MKHKVGTAISATLFIGAAIFLYRELSHVHYPEVARAVGEIPNAMIGLSIALVVGNYLVLTLYDRLSVRVAGVAISLWKTMAGAFIGFVFSHNLGLSVLTGGSIRFRLYSRWGVPTKTIARMIGFNYTTFWLGYLFVLGLVLGVFGGSLPPDLYGVAGHLRVIGLGVLLLVGIYAALSLVRSRHIATPIGNIGIPKFSVVSTQFFIGCLDWVSAAAVLWVLLPGDVPFVVVLGAFLVAQIAGVVSNIPGGLGVFESVMILVLSSSIPSDTLLAVMILYRLAYYLLPLILALGLLGIIEGRSSGLSLSRHIVPVIPGLLAIGTFTAGSIMLILGAIPSVGARISKVAPFAPLLLFELSHFISVLIGTGLLILSRGIGNRVHLAWLLSVGLSMCGVLIALFKGFQYDEAILFILLLAALIPARKRFDRRASLLTGNLSPFWIMWVILVFGIFSWVGFFSTKHIPYDTSLWFLFDPTAHAPRFLRAFLGGLLLLAGYLGARKLLHPAVPPKQSEAVAEDVVLRIVAASPKADAALALTGDKRFIVAEEGDALVMYGIHGRSWISMGDPIGSHDSASDVIHEFMDMAKFHRGRPVFYEVSDEFLGDYAEFGLRFFKLGEEAIIDLSEFSLEGRQRKGLRYVERKLKREGYVTEFWEPNEVAAILPELKSVSDEWLNALNTREKGFSLGWFDETLLSRFPVATVHRDGHVVAFATLWRGAGRAELSVDLMRYRVDAPNGVMDYLFTKIFAWGRQQGYREFNLGMAPLSGLHIGPAFPVWNRLGDFLFRHAEHFYNFNGLRTYKEKFTPEWRPKFIALPSLASLPAALVDVSALVSGGVTGVIHK